MNAPPGETDLPTPDNLRICMPGRLRQSKDEQKTETPTDKRSGVSEVKQRSWIDAYDDIEPDLWLMQKDPSDPHDRPWMQQTLFRAAEQFGESQT